MAKNNYAAKSPLVTMASPHLPPKLLLPFDNFHPIIHPSLDRPHSPPQTALRSNQPFCHSTLFGQTDAQTDRWYRRQVCKNTRLRFVDYI